MQRNDIGIDAGGMHSRRLTPLEEHCLRVMAMRGRGKRARISAERLALELRRTGRDTRLLVNHLIISHKKAIISKAGADGGYWLRGTEDEVEDFCQAFRKRALTGLLKQSQGRKAAYAEIMAQLAFDFDTDTASAALERLALVPDKDPMPPWVQVVHRLLGRMADDPQRYAREIVQIQEDYQDVFVPRPLLRDLRDKATGLLGAIDRIEAAG